ncbi:hypothetical protein BDZ94DRAFT_1232514 [Collybia nuda]|uniref:RNB domain-containing protein n=1 Tax=Collybia nuda TaxID=64659 RepID=A0A9P5YG49_9AGAR|nr:hypothetical protein BDZ94DRAFT_1232514 [Collybia nuda]
MRLIDHTARETKGWTHTRTSRGTEKRLEAKVKHGVQNTRVPSIEQRIFEASDLEFEDLEEDTGGGSLPPGTFIETRRNEMASHAVIFGEQMIDHRVKFLALTTSGEVWMPARDDVMFAIPSFIPVDLAKRCCEGPSMANTINARAEVLKRLRQMELTIENAYNRVSRECSGIYDLIKSPDAEEWATTTVAEVYRIVSPKHPGGITTTLAIHKYLMGDPLHFVARSPYEVTQMFDVRPQSLVDEIQKVQQWSRSRGGPLQAFAEKARKIAHSHRKGLDESRGEIPTQGPGTHTWTPDDKIILGFLLHSLRPYRSNQSDPYSIGQSAVLKLIAPNEATVDDDVLHKTLVNLAVLAPWQDLTVLAPELRLDLVEEAESTQVKERNDLVAKGFSSPPQQGPLGPEDFYSSDPLESVRHDFGNMPVYVIDAEGAEELDDGISIERIPYEPGSFWVHVHIADPGSVIPPSHILAKEAAVQGSSVYSSQRTWPLFPRSLMYSPTRGLSLGARVGVPTRVISFSTKVDSHGNMADFKVRAGIVRNIVITSYDTVDLVTTGSLLPVKYPFGGEPSTPTLPSLPESQIKDFRDFIFVAERLTSKRYKDGVFTISGMSTNLETTRHSSVKSPTLEPSVFRGFPKITYGVAPSYFIETGAHGMVAEMMKLACRATSLFCLERGIPVLRRGLDRPALASESDHQELLDLRMPNCHVSHEIARHIEMPLISATYSLEPVGHFPLGVLEGEGYVRATSPLRRYADLVTHWQLHHALLGSAAPSKNPPFDEGWLQEYSKTLVVQERMLTTMKRSYTKYWEVMFISRWMEDTARGAERYCDPLEDLEGYTVTTPKQSIRTNREQQATIVVPKLGIRCLVEGLSIDVEKGTEMTVEVKECRLGVRPQLIVKRKGQ